MDAARVQDLDRLDAVERSGLVDSARETVFDELAALAAQLLDAPFAFVTAVDAERSFWKAAHGIADGARFNSVSDSFCQYVIEGESELIVGDAANHPLTATNPSIDSMGVAAWAGYPVMLGDQILGTFCVVDQRPREWTAEDRAILRRITDAVNAEISRRTLDDSEGRLLDRRQLEQLRAGLVQVTLPTIPDIDIAAWHRPAGGELVLGDFYDVFAIDADRWCVVIGDVCGHGSVAAMLASLVRTELRAALERTRSPATAMTEVNGRVLQNSPDGGRFATACAIVLQPTEVGLDLTMCSGGHPALAVRGPDGSTQRLPAPDGPPIGVTADATYADRRHVLPAGATLVAHTDGATECRNDVDEMLGDDDFTRLFAEAGRAVDAAGVVSELADALERFTSDHHDDIAIVAMRHRT